MNSLDWKNDHCDKNTKTIAYLEVSEENPMFGVNKLELMPELHTEQHKKNHSVQKDSLKTKSLDGSSTILDTDLKSVDVLTNNDKNDNYDKEPNPQSSFLYKRVHQSVIGKGY